MAITPLRPLPEGWERMFQTTAFRYHRLCTSTCIVMFTCILAYLFKLHITLQMYCVHYIVDRTTSCVFSLRGQSWTYNNLFAFTAMGVTGTKWFVPQPVTICVKIHGRTYHRVLPADICEDPSIGKSQCSLY